MAPTTTATDGGTSPRLELNDDNTAKEADLGGVTTYTAASGSTGSTNTRPELTGVSVVSTITPSQTAAGQGPTGTTIRYTFDEEVTGKAADAASFHVYDASGTDQGTPTVVQIDPAGNAVTVRFTGVDSSGKAAALSVATVDFSAVQDGEGQSNPIGDASVGAGQNRTLTAGTTAAPDLVAVENVRANQTTPSETLVDFRFDEAAFTVDVAGFHLVQTNGTPVDCVAVDGQPGGQPGVNEMADNTITVSCTNPGANAITVAEIARGYVDSETVSDANEAGTTGDTDQDGLINNGEVARAGALNPLQAAELSNTAAGNNTTEPDLESASFFPNGSNPDQVVYDFDEPVTRGIAAADQFRVYLNDGSELFGQSFSQSGSADQVLVTFNDGDLANAVGASVDADAVSGTTGTTGRFNEADEVGVANSNTTAVAAGRTTGPDLTGVAVSTSTTAAGARALATYTFDEDIDAGGNFDEGQFFLVAADGTRYQCQTGGLVFGTTEDNDNTVSCNSFVAITENGGPGDAATNQQITSSVLGTVDDTAVESRGRQRRERGGR